MTLLDPLAIPFSGIRDQYGINYLLKPELAFQIYATIGLITTSTVITPSAHVVLKMKPLFIFLYAVRTI